MRVHDAATGDSAAAFARAYEQVELQLITEAARCADPGAHGLVHQEDYRFVALSVLASSAKEALGETDRVDGIWYQVPPDGPMLSH